MQNFRSLLPLLTALWLLAFQTGASERFTAKVIAVTDGDTIRITRTIPCNQPGCTPEIRQLKCRLAMVDSPELRGQPFGNRAKQMLSDLVFGKDIEVEVIDVDRYGRLVTQIYVDEIWVNAEMVRQGGAWVYRKYARSKVLYDLERQAQQQRLGLWSLPESQRIPPWEWRRKK